MLLYGLVKQKRGLILKETGNFFLANVPFRDKVACPFGFKRPDEKEIVRGRHEMHLINPYSILLHGGQSRHH